MKCIAEPQRLGREERAVAVGAMVAFFKMLGVSQVTFGWLRPAPFEMRFRRWSVATVRKLFQDPANLSRIGMDCALFAVRALSHPRVTADAHSRPS